MTTATDTPPARKPSLFSLADDQRALHDLLTESGGDVSEAEVAAAVDQWMAELATGQQEKFDDYAGVIRALELNASVAEAERERYAKLCDVRANAAQRLKDRLKQFMEASGQARVETPHHKFSVCANGGKAPLEIVDSSAVPEQYVAYEPRLKSDDIRAALARGEEVPGTRLGSRGTHLRIS